MRTLQEKALIDRGPDMTGTATRIFLTARAEMILRDQAERVEAASLSGSQNITPSST
jgi:hypothetical protein